MFVQLNEANEVTGFARRGSSDCPTEVEDEDPRLLAFYDRKKNPPPDPKEQARKDAGKRPDNTSVTIGDLKAWGIL